MLRNPHLAINRSTTPSLQDYQTIGAPVHVLQQLRPEDKKITIVNNLYEL